MTTLTELDVLRRRVQQVIDDQLVAATTVLTEIGDDVSPLTDAVARLLTGGKGLRAGFLYWGYRAGGRPDSDALVRLAASMEFFQGAALLHDDVMDRSDTRRGIPTAHRAVAAVHTANGWTGDADHFGEGAAILAGDLCLTWCDQLYSTSGLPADELARGRGTFDLMRTQLMGGQFLDLLESVRGWDGWTLQERIDSARTVIRYKSAKYTIEHPLLIGATAAGVTGPDLDHLSEYGMALGEAFQLRDDLLGVFGDPEATGKPAGDDLREGKRTVLVAHTLDRATPEQRRTVETLLGRADLAESGVETLREIITASGAVAAVEDLISEDVGIAHTALVRAAEGGRLDEEALSALDALIGVSTARHA